MTEFPLGAIPERIRSDKFGADRLKSGSQPRKPFPKKERAWSHQDELKANIGKIIIVHTTNGTIQAKLLAADAYTIKVDHVWISSDGDERKSILTYFKHSVIGFAFLG